MNLLFLNIVALLLLLGGSIVGYRVAVRELKPRRWRVMACAAAGGAVAAVILIAWMLFTELWSFNTAGELLRPGLPFTGQFALFGLMLGFVGLATGAKSWRRLVICGFAIWEMLALFKVAVDAARDRPPDQGKVDLSYVVAVGLLIYFVARTCGPPLLRLGYSVLRTIERLAASDPSDAPTDSGEKARR